MAVMRGARTCIADYRRLKGYHVDKVQEVQVRAGPVANLEPPKPIGNFSSDRASSKFARLCLIGLAALSSDTRFGGSRCPTPGLAPPATACGATFAAIVPASPVETVPCEAATMRHGLAARRTPLAFVNTFAGSCGVCNIIGPYATVRDESKAQAVSGQLILKCHHRSLQYCGVTMHEPRIQ